MVLDEYELDPGGERLFAMVGNTCWSRPARSRPRKGQESYSVLRLSCKYRNFQYGEKLDEELAKLLRGSRLATKRLPSSWDLDGWTRNKQTGGLASTGAMR